MIIKAVLLMGGSGARFGSQTPKQFHALNGTKLYLLTIKQFLQFSIFKEIIVVCPLGWIPSIEDEIPDGPIKVVTGGKTRQESSYLGLKACGQETNCVVIHDVARPFVSERILQEHITAVQNHQAVNTCLPSRDTLVRLSPQGDILEIPNREEYARVQTPQSFAYPLIMQAHQQASTHEATDDCQLVMNLGVKIKVVEGEEQNFKITTPFDLCIAQNLFQT